ncbi:hypothetical protein [Maritimibacter sp. UBA3975]|uniref:hypothetical protein n=1 Tax=Maritimibacter sp. UBA3975 TaxID=1946833 RepID=UPI000C08E27A|nr:hypothetical protein [Maritimibacter sp. UBA3975]MAM61144.1 hypothetical protein [Maritimibacter sp.]|tara:strand:- start:7986 stop:8213 length:228 start_codon:yes stop_codon:yes gene_type:complete
MAERKRSKDGHSETEEILGGKPEKLDETAQEGAKGGNLQRKVGTRDEEKRVDETSAGNTRPLGGDEDGSGDKEKV